MWIMDEVLDFLVWNENQEWSSPVCVGFWASHAEKLKQPVTFFLIEVLILFKGYIEKAGCVG